MAVLEDSDQDLTNDFSHIAINVFAPAGFQTALLRCCQDGTPQNVQTWATLKMQKLAFGQLECGCWLVEFVSQHR